VAGTVSIALGAAIGIKRQGTSEHVWCFIGDMTAETGTFHDSWKYAMHHGLPITFVIEDNGLSTDTPTQAVWGKTASEWQWAEPHFPNEKDKIIYYRYERKWPHYGTGVFVDFKDAGLKQDGKF
jgi:deoxyxylulose-5-phosphate synthase